MSVVVNKLESKLAAATDPMQSIDLMNALAWELTWVDLPRAVRLAEKADMLSREQQPPYRKGAADSKANLAYFSAVQSGYPESLQMAAEAISLYESLGIIGGQVKPLITIGAVSRYRGDFPAALETGLKALRFSKQADNIEGEAMAANLIGIVHRELGSYADAVAYLEQSVACYRQLGDPVNISMTLSNLARTCLLSGNYEDALAHVEEGLRISREAEHTLGQASLLTVAGEIYELLGDRERALASVREALSLHRQHPSVHPFTLYRTLVRIGELYLQQRLTGEAIDYLQQALSLVEQEQEKPRMYECHRLLAEAYQQQGDFKTALAHFEQFHTIKEAVFDAEFYQIKNIRLQEEIGERLRIEEALKRAKEEAEEANRVKSRFLANMSHELRTPLNAILNFTAFVADGLMGPVNEEQVETLQESIASARHLLSLINDILDLTKIEAGLMELFIQKVDLNEILAASISVGKGLVKDKPIELIAEIQANLPGTYGDKRRLRQIFLNLVSNAIKFTPQGKVTVRAFRDDDLIQVSVSDTGIGIASADQKTIFESFKQAQNDLPETVGTGLGLSISQFFVESHGGQIWVESEVGVGSTFYVRLPILTETEARAKNAQINA